MTRHPLDRPVWASLSTRHDDLSQGGALARRYQRDVNLFAAASDEGPEALAALAALVSPDEQIYVVQAPEIRVPEGLERIKAATVVQMVLPSAMPEPDRIEDMALLGDDDAADMLELATLTQPGPFFRRTHVMGRYIGIRKEGRLAAMAGERFRLDGFTEISAVCTHPDFRGRGLARRLSAAAAVSIQARGETPFLHAWRTNRAAIALYESLGFRHRADLNVAVLARS